MKAILSVILLVLLSSSVFTQGPDFTGLKVALDPGHSGHEGDDRGMANGFWESESNLTKGLWLRDLLEARGAEVFLTRTTNSGDDAVDDWPLSQRAALANDNNVDLFVSIHSNAGGQNYPMPIYNGYTDAPTNPAAKEFAIVLWNHLITNEATYWTHTDPKWIGDLTLNPSWNYGYGVLYPLTVPGIISEGSFHDYQPEVDRLLSLDYRKQESWNMMYAMAEYFGLSDQDPVGNIGGLVRDSLLDNPNISLPDCPDNFLTVKTSTVTLLETGEIYEVGNLSKAQWYFTNYPEKEANFRAGYYQFDSLAPGEYNLIFSAPDYETDTVTVTVTTNSITYWNHWLEIDKSKPPKITAYEPSDGALINCNDPIFLSFNVNMDSASVAEAFSLVPHVDGTFSWDEKYLNAVFQPSVPYDTSKVYTVIIDSTAAQKWGVPMDTTITFEFTTGNKNRYTIVNSFPEVSQQDVNPYLQFNVVFDAPLNNASLINAAAIIDSDGKEIGTKGAVISTVNNQGVYSFQANEDLGYDNNYTLRLLGTIKDENLIPLVDTIDIPFSTSETPDSIIVLDELDNTNNWTLDISQSSEINTTSLIYKWNKHRSGNYSMLVRYNFLGENGTVFLKPDAPIALKDWPKPVGLWIWGDLSENTIVFGFESGEQVLDIIDFSGWDYSSIEIPQNSTELQYIKLVQSENGNTFGDIYIDAISQGYYDNGSSARPLISSDNRSIKIFPNPVIGNQVNIKGIDKETTYEIFNLLGQKTQYGIINEINPVIDLQPQTLKHNTIVLKVYMDETPVSILISINTQTN